MFNFDNPGARDRCGQTLDFPSSAFVGAGISLQCLHSNPSSRKERSIPRLNEKCVWGPAGRSASSRVSSRIPITGVQSKRSSFCKTSLVSGLREGLRQPVHTLQLSTEVTGNYHSDVPRSAFWRRSSDFSACTSTAKLEAPAYPIFEREYCHSECSVEARSESECRS